jgi:hypothetical protein
MLIQNITQISIIHVSHIHKHVFKERLHVLRYWHDWCPPWHLLAISQPPYDLHQMLREGPHGQSIGLRKNIACQIWGNHLVLYEFLTWYKSYQCLIAGFWTSSIFKQSIIWLTISVRLTSALASNSNVTTDTWPFSAAKTSAVLPFCMQ